MANAQSHSFINFLKLCYINITEKKLKPRIKAIDMQQIISTFDTLQFNDNIVIALVPYVNFVIV